MPASIHPLVHRILSRLFQAEAKEGNPWFRDDITIARLTVSHAARGDAVCCSPHVLASYEVLGPHPDKVWPAILARQEAPGPPPSEEVRDAPKKPSQSVKLWCQQNERLESCNPRAVNAIGPPRTSIPPMATAPIATQYRNSAPLSTRKELCVCVSAWMVRIHLIPPSLADYHVSQMDDRELFDRLFRYAGTELSVAGPNPSAVPVSSTRFSRPQRRRQASGTQLRFREGVELPLVMPESGKKNLVRRPGRGLPRLLPESETENLESRGRKTKPLGKGLLVLGSLLDTSA